MFGLFNGVLMRLPAPSPQARTGFLAALAGLLGTGLLQWLVLERWPLDPLGAPGMALWTAASIGLGACLSVLAAAWPKERSHVSVPLWLLIGGALAGVSLGNIVPGLSLLIEDAQRAPPMLELVVVLGGLQRLCAPLALVLAALPAPLLVLAVRARTPRARWLACVGLAWVVTAAIGLVAKALGWSSGVEALLTGQLTLAAGQVRGAALWLALELLLWGGALALLILGRRWAGGVAWLMAGVVMLDPLALAVLRIYALPASTNSFHPTTGAAPGSSLALLDFRGPTPVFDGVALTQPLSRALEAASFWDQGEGFLVDQPYPHPWDFGLQRAIHFAPENDGSCGELVATMSTLRRYGVTLWLWPGDAPESTPGALGQAYAHPVLVVLTHPGQETPEVPVCGELLLGSSEARLRGAEGRVLQLPDQIEELSGLFGDCRGSVVLAPASDTPTSLMFAVLDRLAGTHPDASFRQRAAIRWPGLDDVATR